MLSCLVFFTLLTQDSEQVQLAELREQLAEAGYQRNYAAISNLSSRLRKLSNDSVQYSITLAQTGNAFYTARRIDSALYYMKTVAQLYERLGKLQQAGYSYMSVSKFYRENLQLDEAALAAHKANDIYRTLRDSKNIALSLIEISNLNRALGNNQEAIFYAQRAIGITEISNLSVELAESQLALANAYSSKNNADSAFLLSRLALQTFERLKIPVGIGIAHKLIAESYLMKGNYKQALAHITISEAAAIKTGYDNEISDCYFLKGKILEHMHMPDSAAIMYEQAMTAASGNYMFNKEMDAHLALFKLTYDNGQKAKALQHLIAYTELKDSAFTLEKTRTVEKAQAQYSLREKQREIALLEANARVQEAQIKQAKMFNWFLIVFLVLSAGSAYTLYKLIINRNKARFAQERENLQKLRFNAVMNAEEAQREKISRELHDGVGQLVSIVRLSLSGEDETPATKKSLSILDQAVDELRAISHNLMPQPLVKKGLIEAVKSLVFNLRQTGFVVDFQYPEEELLIDPHRKISIYRIIQEITNNMLKYAEATTISIHIKMSVSTIEIHLVDNGKGFDTNLIAQSNGIGWDNIYTRLDGLNGTMAIKSVTEQGSQFKITIPRLPTQEN